MSWAFAIFGIFAVFFLLVFVFFVYVYHKEYDREERVMIEVAKANEKQLKYDLVYIPNEPVSKVKTKKVPQQEEPLVDVIPNKPKKDFN